MNIGVLYGFGSNGGLKKGNQGYEANLGYETDRFGVQLVYEEFKDAIRTSTDATLSNVIDLTVLDQKTLMLSAKYKLTEKLHTQVGFQQARMKTPTPDPNIPFINNVYGENVGKSTAYVGETQKMNVAHRGSTTTSPRS